MFCITGGVCFTGGISGGPVTMPVDFLVLAGGGGGGSVCLTSAGGGGGGAGGAKSGSTRALHNTPYTIVVGSGGACGTYNCSNNTNGQNSCFGPNVSCGGGKGGLSNMPYWGTPGPTCPGGSGGGGGVYQNGCPGVSGEGNSGGPWFYYVTPSVPLTFQIGVGGGGGGGISTAGRVCCTTSGLGGAVAGQGCFYPFNNVFSFGELCNSCRWIGGGGGGGVGTPIYLCGYGLGGGGKGGVGFSPNQAPVAVAACPGATNMGAGGGGGGAGYTPSITALASGSGGSGSVFLRYPSNYADATTTGSPCYCCITNCFKYYWFQGSGSISFSVC